MTQKKLPKFKSREEFAHFWDTHSLADYLNDTEKVDQIFVLAPQLAKTIKERSKKRMVALRLPEWHITRAKNLAKKLHVPYQSIVRRWVETGIVAEQSSKYHL
jgi:predicted DNA binding CopG/RHH family protein